MHSALGASAEGAPVVPPISELAVAVASPAEEELRDAP